MAALVQRLRLNTHHALHEQRTPLRTHIVRLIFNILVGAGDEGRAHFRSCQGSNCLFFFLFAQRRNGMGVPVVFHSNLKWRVETSCSLVFSCVSPCCQGCFFGRAHFCGGWCPHLTTLLFFPFPLNPFLLPPRMLVRACPCLTPVLSISRVLVPSPVLSCILPLPSYTTLYITTSLNPSASPSGLMHFLDPSCILPMFRSKKNATFHPTLFLPL